MKTLQRGVRWLLALRGSPEAIARGAAIGMLVAFTPTIGFQVVIALALATVTGASRPIAVVPVWITNPATIPPIFAFTFYVGSFLWPGPPGHEVRQTLHEAALHLRALDFFAMGAQLAAFARVGFDVMLAMTLGGLIVGGIAAALTYPVVLGLVRRLRRRRERRRLRRRSRPARRRRLRSGA